MGERWFENVYDVPCLLVKGVSCIWAGVVMGGE